MNATTLTHAAPPSSAERLAGGFLARYSNTHTRQGYRTTLKQWFAWCYSYGLDPLTAKRPEIEMWARMLEEDRQKPSTVAGKLNVLAAFYKVLCADEVIDRNPMLNVRRPTVPRESTTNGLTHFELAACLKVAERDHDHRAHALLCLLGLNGLRISGALGIDVDAIGEHHYQTIVTFPLKGGGNWTVPLAPRTTVAVRELIGDRQDGPLFLTTGGLRMHRQTAHRMVKRIALDAGITKRISPHSFRHAFVTNSLDGGANPRDVMNSTGHRDPRMVSYYDRNRASVEHNTTWVVAQRVAGVS